MRTLNETQCDWGRRVAEEYYHGRPLALLFDFDGTLTPIVRHPSLARLSSQMRNCLQLLNSLPRVGVGVISGRALGELRGLIDLDGVYLAGSGGLEIDLLGVVHRDPNLVAISKLFDVIQDSIIDIVRKYPCTWLERKPGALSIHFRGLLPLLATAFRCEIASTLSAFESLRLRVVSEAIEVTPAHGWDKGHAVALILDHISNACGSDPLPIYFGDAPNDTEGMLVAVQHGGVSIGFGPDAPQAAQVHFENSSILPECLENLSLQLRWPRDTPALRDRTQSDKQTSKGDLLLLDPDAQSRTELADGLKQCGWRVWQSETPDEANAHLAQHGEAIRVALVDLQLPGFQGAKTVADLGRSKPDLLRCYMAGNIRQDTAMAFAELSSKPLFLKPIQAAELDSALESILQSNAMTRV
ncbi:hypothetical protein BH11PLA2_BH11PLA2_31730 [soil metagenome]